MATLVRPCAWCCAELPRLGHPSRWPGSVAWGLDLKCLHLPVCWVGSFPDEKQGDYCSLRHPTWLYPIYIYMCILYAIYYLQNIHQAEVQRDWVPKPLQRVGPSYQRNLSCSRPRWIIECRCIDSYVKRCTTHHTTYALRQSIIQTICFLFPDQHGNQGSICSVKPTPT